MFATTAWLFISSFITRKSLCFYAFSKKVVKDLVNVFNMALCTFKATYSLPASRRFSGKGTLSHCIQSELASPPQLHNPLARPTISEALDGSW